MSAGGGSSLRIVVLGYVVRCPLGGMFWHHAQYALGLRELGHDVWFFEDSEDYPCCYDPNRHETSTDATFGLGFTERAFGRLGMSERWAYFDAHQDRWHGPAADRRNEVFTTADVLINISGVNPVRSWLRDVPRRVYIDTDPVFEQVLQLSRPERRRRADAHNRFFTFGECVAAGTSEAPDDGRPWLATRQPIVRSLWPVRPPDPSAPFTSVMQWESYPAREYAGRRFGMKSESFEPFVDLPRRLPNVRFQLALGSVGAPRERLGRHGWEIRDPLEVTRTPWSYRSYLGSSIGEIGVAKHGYVAGRSGWFSERSAAYLASGRPVLLQETGYSESIESGTGVVPFNDLEAAVEGVMSIVSDYRRHSAAASDIAATYFDAHKVLGRLLEQATGSEDYVERSAGAEQETLTGVERP